MNTLIMVKYLYRGEEISASFAHYYEVGERYYIQSPTIEGYICDKRIVSGKAGINDICIVVNYEMV